MRQFLFFVFMLFVSVVSAQVSGYVYEEDGKPMSGTTVTLISTGQSVQTSENGYFFFKRANFPDSLAIVHIGYEKQIKGIQSPTDRLMVHLVRDSRSIEVIEVVNTGFYQIPKERATGSFTVIDNELLNRSVGGNILQRLDGVASGVQFVTANGSDPSDIRVRGLATIQSDASPLVVIDDFPYEGDITSINPNDIESVTVLKDAAAASIWGARAGNGVIVITTKQGRYNQKGQLSLNSNLSIHSLPDLMYGLDRLPSDVVMEIEKKKYEQGGYYRPDAQQQAFPEYVEMLMARDNGTLSEAEFMEREAVLASTEVREEAMKHLYRPSMYQQYALTARGGGASYTYYVSGGYDHDRANVIGNASKRINFNVQNTFRPFKNMELSTALWYSQQHGANNGLGLSGLQGSITHVGLSPYIRLADGTGAPLPIIKDYRQTYVEQAEANGLLDWQYKPLEERNLIDRHRRSEELRANMGIHYHFFDRFVLRASYQYVTGNNESSVVYDRDSYYARNLVNRFTQPNGNRVVPYGGILQHQGRGDADSHSGRLQLDYNRRVGADHEIVSLVGGEMRQSVQDALPGHTLYNYDPELLIGNTNYNYTDNFTVRPTGRARIPAPPSGTQRTTDRYLSYFSNVGYTYKERYIVSGSLRWDGSNLFGVKTNQKGTPLWSIGGSWVISAEEWSKFSTIEYLRLRTTYGSAGNVNKDVSVYPTIRHLSSDPTTGMPSAFITSVGNPSLRWEQVRTFNIGWDTRMLDGRLSIGIDYYAKTAKDLIGADILPPSTGIYTGSQAENSNLINYADLSTQGIDLQLNSINVRGRFDWSTKLLFHTVRNKVTDYKVNDDLSASDYLSGRAISVGQSRDIVYSIPRYSLDPERGTVVMEINGEPYTDAASFVRDLTLADLDRSGVGVPPVYGSLRNDWSWKGISLSVLLTWKSGHVFRRSTHGPGGEYMVQYHMDYLKRWQNPGDEISTDVPATSDVASENLYGTIGRFGNFIEKGSHIRLQDIGLSYNLRSVVRGRSGPSNVRLYSQLRNLGVVWKSNGQSMDPDYPNAAYLPPKMFAVGLQVEF